MTEKPLGMTCSRRERDGRRFPPFQEKPQWLESDL
jgi:hypothetical protein